MPRSGRRAFTVALSATALWLIALPTGAQACSCASTGSPRDDARAILAGSDAAFIGVLRSVRPTEDQGLDREAVFRYRVRHAYGAEFGPFVRLVAGRVSASCGLAAREGRRYALGIYRRRGEWTSNLCSYMRPRALRAVAEDERMRAQGDGDGCAAA